MEKIAKEKKDWKKKEGKYRDKLEVKQDFKSDKLSTFKMLWLSIWRITFLLDNCSCFYSKLSRGLLLKGLEKICFDWGNLRPVLMSSTFEKKKKKRLIPFIIQCSCKVFKYSNVYTDKNYQAAIISSNLSRLCRLDEEEKVWCVVTMYLLHQGVRFWNV